MLLAVLAEAADLTGRVVRVADGDTITILVEAEEGPTQVRVRLWGIDAPEKAQPFGERSREALAAKVAGQVVRVEERGKDRWRRVLGVVWVDGRNVNLAQVVEGYAWHFTRYSKDAQTTAAEVEARKFKQGLWRDLGTKAPPVPPWEWRREKKGNS